MEGADGVLEAVAPDEPHGVIGPAVAVAAQAVDRDDPGVLQAAGDLGFEEEPGPAVRVVGVLVEDLLERDLAVQLRVEGDEDRAQAAPRVGAEIRNRWPSLVAMPTESVASASRPSSGAVEPEPTRTRVASTSGPPTAQALVRRLAGRDRGQALLRVAAVLPDELGQRLERPLGGVEVARARGGRPGSWTCPASRPGRRHELGWLMIPF